jgi:hypothetical protein
MPPTARAANRGSDVEALSWREFLERQRDEWDPGEHWLVVAPTGEGKTTFTGGLVKTRKFVLALDQKGGDKTLSALGWERMTRWPPTRADRRDMADGIPFRRIVGSLKRDKLSFEQRWNLHKQILEAVMEEGGWTILAPDLAALTSRAFGNAWDEVVKLLILLRDAGGSMVTDIQRPSGVPREAGEMATYLAIGYTRDKDTVSRLAEMMGRTAAEVRGAVAGLGDLPFGWLVVSRRPRDPIILTRPEKL